MTRKALLFTLAAAAAALASSPASSEMIRGVRALGGVDSAAQITRFDEPKAKKAAPARSKSSAPAFVFRGDASDPVGLASLAAIAVDQETGAVYFEKNAGAALPIASITKMMTALVTLEAGLPLEEKLAFTGEDSVLSTARSHFSPGMTVTRGEALHAALMSSDNRAAHLLARTFPGGTGAFVSAMNAKAAALGMTKSRFADSTGLSAGNVSTAKDLTLLARAAYAWPAIRELSTTSSASIATGSGATLKLRTTNRLVANGWDLGLQKTGTTTAAGRCMLLQTIVSGRPLLMAMLHADSGSARIRDAEKLRAWLETVKLRGGGKRL